MSLKTDYKDDILAVGNLRKYQMIQNNDGTVSFQDVTQYEQTGDVFGAGDINRTNQAVNEKFDSGDVVDPMLTTEPGFAADAYQTKLQFDEQNKKLINTDWIKLSEKHNVYYKVTNSIVCVIVNADTAMTADEVIGVIPEEHRPTLTTSKNLLFSIKNPYQDGYVMFNKTGVISVSKANSAGFYVYATFSYPLG